MPIVGTGNYSGNIILGSCIALSAAALSVSALAHLRTVREETRVKKPSLQRATSNVISQETEDAIEVETLGELYECPNYDTRQAAVKLVIERVLRSGAYPLLLKQVHSRKSEVYTPALHSLRFLATSSPVPLPAPTVDTCAAVIQFLARKNRVSAKRQHVPNTDWKLRTPGEQHALAILEALGIAHLADALAAGMITKWLAHYPFGGHDASTAQRQAVVRKIIAHQTDDDRLASILVIISCAAEGRKQMRAAGLIGSVIEEKEHGCSLDDDEDRDYIIQRGTRRSRDESEGEMATRRRRRQAMVFSEGGGPVTRENIYENEW